MQEDNKRNDIVLAEKLKILIDQYSIKYEIVKNNNDWKNPFRNIIANEIPTLISECIGIASPYIVTGSYGKGRWTMVPWIAIFDTRITSSAQSGVYIVYLLNKDRKEFYLTLNQGATNVIFGKNKEKNHAFVGVAGQSNKENLQKLKTNADLIRNQLNSLGFDYGDEINTGSSNYDAGAIFYKKYTLDSFPSGEKIVEDLQKMMKIYSQYASSVGLKGTVDNMEDWSPSKSEYNPNISKDQWLELLKDGSTFTDNAMFSFAALYDFGGEATCKQLAQKYGKTVDFYRNTMGTQLADKVRKQLGIPYYYGSDGKRKVWPIPFQGRDAGSDEPGSFVWKLRDELKVALKEFDVLRFLPEDSGAEEMNTKDTITKVKTYIASKGFAYEDGLVENFYLSLKSKPFVILAGTSGTGKTKLVKLFAEAIGAEYQMVPVRPDWSDSSDLFGHLDLNGRYIPGAVIDYVLSATENPETPYILCLDEMNLARVEYYMSDFLSIIETREMNAGTIISKPLVPDQTYGEDNDARTKYGELGFPENLYLVGTVNMDETTFPFSKKVLDRANTIEFDYVDLIPSDTEYYEVEPVQVTNDFLKSNYVLLSQCEDRELIQNICTGLEDINKILREANAHVGYRVRDEIVFYMLNNKNSDLLSTDRAFDNEILQKILPRIQGSSSHIKDMLIELYKYCMGDFSGIDSESVGIADRMKEQAENGRYTLSAKKIAYMMSRFEEDGFTSYWL